jgi:Flp pilus assembly protein TadB
MLELIIVTGACLSVGALVTSFLAWVLENPREARIRRTMRRMEKNFQARERARARKIRRNKRAVRRRTAALERR